MSKKNFWIVTESYLKSRLTAEEFSRFIEKFNLGKIDEAMLFPLVNAEDMEAENAIINRNLKTLREQNNLTQTDLANVLSISQKDYWRFEQDGYKVNPYILRALAAFYNVSADWILGLTAIQKPLYNSDKISSINDYSLSSLKYRKLEKDQKEQELIALYIPEDK